MYEALGLLCDGVSQGHIRAKEAYLRAEKAYLLVSLILFFLQVTNFIYLFVKVDDIERYGRFMMTLDENIKN